MKFRGVLSLALAVAAGCMVQKPANAVPRYRVQPLPDRGQGSVALMAGTYGRGSVAVGDVNDDGDVTAALWTQAANRWQLRALSDAGHGGSARTLSSRSGRLLVAGTLRDEAGLSHAAVWTLQPRARGGWTEALSVLNSTPGSPSEVVGFVENTSRVIVVGNRETAAGSGVFQPITWELLADGAVQATPLVGLGGLSARAVGGGIVLPNGAFRIPGNAQPMGSSLELACEWRGAEPQGLMALLLPAAAPGVDDYQLLGTDPLLRYGGGRQQVGGTSLLAGWATFPASAGDWSPLPLASQSELSGNLFCVNSSGRAITAMDDWESPVTLRLHAPAGESRPIPLNTLWDSSAVGALSGRVGAAAIQFTDVLVSSISDRGIIAGGGVGGGPHRAVLLLPSGVDAADYLSVSEGEAATEASEPALFYIDDIIIGIRGAAPDEWLGLKAKIDIAHTVRNNLVITVAARVDGPRQDGARQVLCLWSFTQDRYVEVNSVTLRGGRLQTLKHRLPAGLSQFVSPHGDLHISLRWNGDGFSHSGEGYSVLVDSVTLGNR